MAKCPLLDLILLELKPFCIKSINWHTRLQKFKTDFFSCTRRAFLNQLLTTPNVLHLVLTLTFSTMVSLFWKSCSPVVKEKGKNILFHWKMSLKLMEKMSFFDVKNPLLLKCVLFSFDTMVRWHPWVSFWSSLLRSLYLNKMST